MSMQLAERQGRLAASHRLHPLFSSYCSLALIMARSTAGRRPGNWACQQKGVYAVRTSSESCRALGMPRG